MTPKQMIEAEIKTLRGLADTWESRASKTNFPHHIGHFKGRACGFENAADRLESLLKLEGWE